MALLAVGRESRRSVVRIGGGEIISVMTSVALHRCARVSRRVAAGACHLFVQACQGELRLVVVKCRWLPCGRVVTLRTVGGETIMVGITCVREIGSMTGDAL